MTSEIFYLTEQFVRGARTGKAFQGGSGTAQHYTKGGFELPYL